MKIGIVFSDTAGAGWSTENTIACALDQKLANLIESGANSADVFALAAHNWPQNRLAGARSLDVVWVEEGTKFWIEHYDGIEHVITEDSFYTATI